MQSAQSDLKKSVEGFIAEDDVRYIVEIRGVEEQGVEIRTLAGETCSDSTTDLVRSRLAKDFAVRLEKEMRDEPGNLVTSYNRRGPNGEFTLETILVEFGPEERQLEREKVIRNIAEIADLLNARVPSSRGH